MKKLPSLSKERKQVTFISLKQTYLELGGPAANRPDLALFTLFVLGLRLSVYAK